MGLTPFMRHSGYPISRQLMSHAMTSSCVDRLDRWQIGPNEIVATQFSSSEPSRVELQRPVCPYPRKAPYLGVGSTRAVANFTYELRTADADSTRGSEIATMREQTNTSCGVVGAGLAGAEIALAFAVYYHAKHVFMKMRKLK